MEIGQLIFYKQHQDTTPEYFGKSCIVVSVGNEYFKYRTIKLSKIEHAVWEESISTKRF